VSPDPLDRNGPKPVITSAHMPMIVIGLAVLVAFIIAVGVGAINEQTFVQPVTPPGAPITVP
jgi:hypothetical protein